MNQYAVNPSTGEVQEFNGQAWAPVESARVAKNAAGDMSVFNGQAWTPLGTPKPQSPSQYGANAGPMMKPLADMAGRELGLTARAVGTGLMSIPNAVGDATNEVLNWGIRGANSLMTPAPTMSQLVTGEKPQGPIPYLGHPSDVTQQAMTATGLPEANTPGEKAVQIAGSVLAGGPSFTAAVKGLEAAGVKGLESAAEQGWSGLQGFFKSGGSKAPTNAMLKDTAQQAYKASEEAGAVLKPEAIQGVAAKVEGDLAQYGYLPKLQPQIGAVLDELARVSSQPITMKGVDTLRKVVVNVAQDGNPSERMMAGKIIEHIDDMMENIKPGDVVMGDATEAAAQLVKARDTWKTFRKSELIDNLVTKGEDQALSTNSGGNVQNAIRQKLRTLLDNPRTARLFSAEEKDAIRQIVRGTPTQNALRIAGGLAPSSNGWLGVISTVAGGPAGALIPIAGSVAKAGATALTNRSVANLSTMIRTGGQAAPKAAQVPLIPDATATAARLLGQGTSVPNSPYLRALIQQLSGGSVPATASPNTGSQGQP